MPVPTPIAIAEVEAYLSLLLLWRRMKSRKINSCVPLVARKRTNPAQMETTMVWLAGRSLDTDQYRPKTMAATTMSVAA
jgi:hypothetical protein